jgi:hypothetical protein
MKKKVFHLSLVGELVAVGSLWALAGLISFCFGEVPLGAVHLGFKYLPPKWPEVDNFGK